MSKSLVKKKSQSHSGSLFLSLFGCPKLSETDQTMTDKQVKVMQTDDLELESNLAEALGTACNAIGRKRVALMLWPEKSAESGQKEVSDCLHPDRRSKFSLEQIDLILTEARKADCHAPMTYFARSLSYKKPTPITPESERDRLQREFIKATHAMQQLSKQMERLGANHE